MKIDRTGTREKVIAITARVPFHSVCDVPESPCRTALWRLGRDHVVPLKADVIVGRRLVPFGNCSTSAFGQAFGRRSRLRLAAGEPSLICSPR